MTNTNALHRLTTLGCALLLLGACGTPPVRGPAAARAFLDTLVRDGKAPGVQYAHFDRDRLLLEYAAGSADLRGKVLVDAHTTFHGYSVTKTFTAAVVCKLAAEGKIELDAPISNWVDGLPDERVPTVRQTLQHVGGWRNPVPVGWVHRALEHSQHDEAAFFARIMREHGRLASQPGEKFAYSNVGYLVLGELVRRVSGRTYTEYVEQELLAPLDLASDAKLGFAYSSAGHAKGYVRRWSFLGLAVGLFIDRSQFLGPPEGAWNPFVPLQVDGAAYGGLLGNARGFGRYLQAILRREGPLSEELVRVMFEPGRLANGERTPAAHGWFRGEVEGHVYFQHAGGGGGYYAEIRVYPGLGRASVLMMNRSAMKDDRLLDRLDALLLPAALGPDQNQR
jgi:D-alanyl-D-alanine carboxypeptidase